MDSATSRMALRSCADVEGGVASTSGLKPCELKFAPCISNLVCLTCRFEIQGVGLGLPARPSVCLGSPLMNLFSNTYPTCHVCIPRVTSPFVCSHEVAVLRLPLAAAKQQAAEQIAAAISAESGRIR